MQTRTLTYLGRRCVQTEVRLSGGARSILTYWIDPADHRNGGYAPGTTVWAVYKGDARKGTLKTLVAPNVIVASTE